MIAKRIPHKTQCDHAQTPYQRRKCRAAALAAAQKEKTMQDRYQVKPGPRPGVWTVVDTETGEVLMRERNEAMIRRYAHDRNSMPEPTNAAPAAPAAPAPVETPRTPTGWSTAAKRRAGRRGRSHPLGVAVEAGAGYTIYQDTTFGGGRVQIWDES